MADHADIDHTGLPGVGTPADILDIPTAEMDDTLVLAPDGAGGVEFRAEAGGGGGGAFGFATQTADQASLNSTSLADITGLSVTLTTGAKRCLCIFSGTFTRTGGSNGIALSVDVDGTQVGSVPYAFFIPSSYMTISFQVVTGVLSAASHTIKVRYKADSGTTWTLLGSAGTGVGNFFTVTETSLAS